MSTTGATPTTDGGMTGSSTTGTSTTDGTGTAGESEEELCGAPGQVRWIKQFDAASDTGYNGLGLAVDGAGNVILVGKFHHPASFGGETFVVTDDWPDAFVAKFDTEGNHLWSRHFGGLGEQRIDEVAVDDDGSIALGGRFSGSIDLGGGELTAVSFMDVLVARLSPEGEHLWSRSFAGSDMATVGRVSQIAAVHGETVFAADIGTSVDFGGGEIGLPDGSSFVVKLDAAGGHVWSQAMGGPGSFESTGLAVDGDGVVWVSGRFDQSAIFDDEPPMPVAGMSMYVARFAADGQPQPALVSTGAPTHVPYAPTLAADGAGRVHVGGSFVGGLEFGGALLGSSGSVDGFLLTLDGEGAPLRQVAFGQGEHEEQGLLDIAGDAAGRTALAGQFQSGIDLGGISLSGNPAVDGFVANADRNSNQVERTAHIRQVRPTDRLEEEVLNHGARRLGRREQHVPELDIHPCVHSEVLVHPCRFVHVRTSDISRLHQAAFVDGDAFQRSANHMSLRRSGERGYEAGRSTCVLPPVHDLMQIGGERQALGIAHLAPLEHFLTAQDVTCRGG